MDLTITERAILANQFRILSKFEDEDSEEHLKNAEILENGYKILYPEVVSNIHKEEQSIQVGKETFAILTMFMRLDHFVTQLSQEERDQLNIGRLHFDGFDANNDAHYFFARFLIEKGDRYQERSEMDLNSHSIFSLQRYLAMLPVYLDLMENNNNNLGLAELLQIQNAV